MYSEELQQATKTTLLNIPKELTKDTIKEFSENILLGEAVFCLKHPDDKYAKVTRCGKQEFSVIDRSTKEETIFNSVDDLVNAGWVLDWRKNYISNKITKESNLNIPRFNDCEQHCNSEAKNNSAIFITEQCNFGEITELTKKERNIKTQAVYEFRGKSINCHVNKSKKVMENNDFKNLIQILGIDKGIDNLRYKRIIITTGNTVDGFQIQNLILTFFLTNYKDLVINGNLYLLENDFSNNTQEILNDDKNLIHLKINNMQSVPEMLKLCMGNYSFRSKILSDTFTLKEFEGFKKISNLHLKMVNNFYDCLSFIMRNRILPSIEKNRNS